MQAVGNELAKEIVPATPKFGMPDVTVPNFIIKPFGNVTLSPPAYALGVKLGAEST
jgi:hypothetical protein